MSAQPDWVRAGRCDFCPREANLHAARCGCGHEVGVQLCASRHLDRLHEGEVGCRVCAHDLERLRQHWCTLVPVADKAVRMADPAPPESITCPRCGMTSRGANDVAYRYCPNCHLFHDQMGRDDIEPDPEIERLLYRQD